VPQRVARGVLDGFNGLNEGSAGNGWALWFWEEALGKRLARFQRFSGHAKLLQVSDTNGTHFHGLKPEHTSLLTY
jgi:hypothetical protein